MMFIPVWLMSLLGVAVIGIASYAWNYLFNAIRKLSDCQANCQNTIMVRRVDDTIQAKKVEEMLQARMVEDKEVSSSKMDLLKAQIGEIVVWRARTEEMMDQNRREHLQIVTMLERMDLSIRDLEKCVNLLIAGKEC